MKNRITIFLVVSSKFLQSTKREENLDTLGSEIYLIRSKFWDLGYAEVVVQFFDPVDNNWGVHWQNRIRNSDLILFYMPQGESYYFGKGFKEINLNYDHVPKLISYHTINEDEMRFYHYTLFGDMNGQDWTHYQRVKFGPRVEGRSLLRLLSNSTSKDIDGKPVAIQQASKYKYIYKSMFGD